ncbi:hypothetical protein [Clostridium sp.]|uniref:hypothetical protein n=1 Tax=Clostridium sp. TaxID=1506 RepID=UPI003D6CADC7
MKIRRNMFLEVSNNKILIAGFSKNIILNKAFNIAFQNSYIKDIANIKDFQLHIKNKNLYVLVEGETVYIKMMTLPTVKKHQINDMIKNELRYYYKDIDHIAFTYKLKSKDKFNMEILVFCLQGNSLDILKNCIDNNINLKKINLIQFCFKNYYSDKIHESDYILVFYYDCNLYSLICCDNEIVANNIISVNELAIIKFSYVMNEFLEQYNDYALRCKKIYYANIKELNVKELDSIALDNEAIGIEELTYLKLPKVILDNLKQEELVKYMIKKG